MKRIALALVALLAIGASAFAQVGSWPPPAGFQAIYPPVGATVVNCGGSITTGGTAQVLFTAAQYKQGFLLQVGVNDSNTDPIYFSPGTFTTTPGAGVAGSYSLTPSSTITPGGIFSTPLNFPVGVAYYINAATTGDKFKCMVW